MPGPAPWRVVGTLTTNALDLSRFHSGLAWITVVVCVAACIPAGLRWLRVAQREHYLTGSVTLFAVRWWRSTAANRFGAAVGLAAAVASLWLPLVGILTAAVVVAGPLGLSVRGRTVASGLDPATEDIGRSVGRCSKRWSSWSVVVFGLPSVAAVLAALAVPFLVDLACAVTAPFERRAVRPLRRPGRPPVAGGPPHDRGHHRILRQDLDQEPRGPHRDERPARWWPPRPVSTTVPDWPGPSMSIWPRARRSS